MKCYQLTYFDIKDFDTSKQTDITNCFAKCTSIEIDPDTLSDICAKSIYAVSGIDEETFIQWDLEKLKSVKHKHKIMEYPFYIIGKNDTVRYGHVVAETREAALDLYLSTLKVDVSSVIRAVNEREWQALNTKMYLDKYPVHFDGVFHNANYKGYIVNNRTYDGACRHIDRLIDELSKPV